MTEQHKHGEPGHECKPLMVDATDALAGVIIRASDDTPGAVTADSWSHGLTKRAAAFILRDLADSWDADADREEAESQAADDAAELAAIAELN